MKGDFSRSTFKREKHYSSVRMQQGRVQVDADWNEQADIQEHLRISAVRDLIGQSGAPVDGGGFRLELTPDEKDFIIHPGRFYVDGILCELEEEAVEVIEEKNLQLDPGNYILSVSGLNSKNYAKGQWVEVFYDKDKTQRIQVASSSDTGLVLQGFNASAKEVKSGISIRRLTTYNHQPYSPENSTSLSADGQYLAYLDVWYRHITDIDDVSIRELALGGPDTASRIQTVWQVKLKALTDDESDENYIKKPCSLLEYREITPSRHARMAADVGESGWSSDDCTKVDASGYYGLENRLYRIEIQDLKKKSKKFFPRFKWFRDNGSIVREIKFDNSTASISGVEVLGRDVSTVFTPDSWIEITDELTELQEQPGVLVLTKIVNGNHLSFDPPAIGSDDEKAINTIRSRACKPRIRLWDCVTDSYPLEGTTTSKIDIEKGIKIKFMDGDEYKPGDYWLIPARTIDSSIEWEKDVNGNGKFLERFGIKHHYCAIAKVTFDNDNKISVSDVRHTFGSLTTPSLYYVGGDGQEVMPGNPLPQPLEVCVTDGPVPVEGACVKFAFKIPKGNGRLIDSSDNTNKSANWIKVRTNSKGIASCYCTPNSLNWNTDSTTWHQKVEAVLLDADCGAGNVQPVHFNASLSVARDVAYTLPDCAASNVTCNVVGTSYQYWLNDQYPSIDLFGKKYVPLLSKSDPIWKSHVNKLAKLVLDNNEKYTLINGEKLDLGGDYALEAKHVDVDGKKVWLEFTRDGEYIDDKIISVADDSDATWDVQRDDIQGEDNVIVLKVHIGEVFQRSVDSIAQINGLWLIDYANVIALKVGDTLGENTITNIVNGVNSSNPGSLIFYHDCAPSNVTCTVVGIGYQYWSGEQYPSIDLFGEKYVPLLAKGDPIWKSHVNKLSKLVRDDNEKYTLKTGDMLDLGSGYSLQAKQVDIDSKTVWLEFTRDREYIDDKIISVADGSDSTWDVQRDDIQDEDDIAVLRIHVNQIFQGAADSIAQIEGIWLIDYANAITLEIGGGFGEFTLDNIIDGVDASNPGSLIFKRTTNPDNEFPTVQKLLKQKISGWPPREDEVGNVSVKGILDTLLCKLDAGKIPYNPLIKEERWKDINETGDLFKLTKPNTVQDALDDLVANLDSSDIPYRPKEDCPASTTVRSLLDIPADKDSKIKDIFDTLLCKLDAGKIPYNPLINENRWKDINETSDLGKPPAPNTVQDALDNLAVNLDSSDISYRPVKDCPASTTVGSLLDIPANKDSKIKDIFDALLCNFNATHLPLDLSDGKLCTKLEKVKTVQDALKVLCGEIGGVGGPGCCIIVQNSEQLQEALKKLQDDSTICLLAGKYSEIREFLISGCKNIVIRGCNLASKLFTNIQITDCQNVVIENLDISGNISVGKVTDFSMKGNVVSHVNDQGFKVYQCQGVVIEYNLFTIKSQKGLVFETSNDLNIHKNRINIAFSNTEINEVSSIFAVDSSDIEITNNLIQISDSEGINEKATVIGMRLGDIKLGELEGNLSVVSNTVNAINAPSLNIQSEGHVRVHGNIFKSVFRNMGKSSTDENNTVNIESPENQITFTDNQCDSESFGPTELYKIFSISMHGRNTIFSNNQCAFIAHGETEFIVKNMQHVHIIPSDSGFVSVIGNRCSEKNIVGNIYSISVNNTPGGLNADQLSILLGNITTNEIRPEPDPQKLNLQRSI